MAPALPHKATGTNGKLSTQDTKLDRKRTGSLGCTFCMFVLNLYNICCILFMFCYAVYQASQASPSKSREWTFQRLASCSTESFGAACKSPRAWQLSEKKEPDEELSFIGRPLSCHANKFRDMLCHLVLLSSQTMCLSKNAM